METPKKRDQKLDCLERLGKILVTLHLPLLGELSGGRMVLPAIRGQDQNNEMDAGRHTSVALIRGLQLRGRPQVHGQCKHAKSDIQPNKPLLF